MQPASSDQRPTWQEYAENAVEYFVRETEYADLCDPIDEAIHRGTRRKHAKMVNVIVHPEFAWHPKTPLQNDLLEKDIPAATQGTKLYEQRITALLKDDPHAIVIAHNGARQCKPDLPYDEERALFTPMSRWGGIQGMLDAQGWHTFLAKLDGIREDDEFRIHGAAWNRCPKQFAQQLLGTVAYRCFLPPQMKETPDDEQKQNFKTLMYILHRLQYVREKTRIRLGIQHNSQNVLCPDSLCQDLTETGITKLHPRRKFALKSIAQEHAQANGDS